jgi:diaminopimelate decarboxylase
MDPSTTALGAGPHAYPVNAKGHLEVGGVDAFELVAEYGTPLHVLDEDRLRGNCRSYRSALTAAWPNSRVLFASKACCIMATCRIAHDEGLGVDIASGGELYTALRAGVPAADLVFHGSNKTADEIDYGLRAGVGRFVVDNEHELDLLEAYTARLGLQADILLRLTPGIEPHTHKAIQTGGVDSKFGFGLLDGSAFHAARRAARLERVRLRGFHAHIGSQVFDLEPFRLEAAALLDFAARARDELDIRMEELNLGGGLGIRYLADEIPPSIDQYVRAVIDVVAAKVAAHRLHPPTVNIEPGRSIVGTAGVTLYTVGASKTIPGTRTYISVDGGMNENPRPALYGARYEAVLAARPTAAPVQTAAVAGRCCESGDVLIWEARLPEVRSGDVLAVFSTGAYTYSMASNYNRFPRPAVVLAGGGRSRVVVERETYEDLVRKDVAL